MWSLKIILKNEWRYQKKINNFIVYQLMLLFFRIVELGWLLVAIFSIHGIYSNINQNNTRLYIFCFTLIASVFMFFLRRNKRIEYQKKKDNQ